MKANPGGEVFFDIDPKIEISSKHASSSFEGPARFGFVLAMNLDKSSLKCKTNRLVLRRVNVFPRSIKRTSDQQKIAAGGGLCSAWL